MNVIEERLEERLRDARVDMSHFDPYSGQTMSAEDEVVMSEGLARFFVEAADERLGGPLSPLVAATNRRMLRMSLSLLSRFQSPVAIPYARQLLNMDPSLADRYGAYLRSAVDGHGEDVSGVLDEMFGHHHLSPWEFSWLLEPMLEPTLGVTDTSTEAAVTFTRGLASGPLRARAAVALAVQEAIGVQELMELLEQLPAVARPDLVAALGIRVSTRSQATRVRTAIGDNPLYEWIFDRARSGSGTGWL